jgi:hypothetical protein
MLHGVALGEEARLSVAGLVAVALVEADFREVEGFPEVVARLVGEARQGAGEQKKVISENSV